MSILIKGVDMPKDGCSGCIFVNRKWHCFICPILKREVTGNVERGGFQTDCPLIPVLSHGWLIDALEKQVGKKPDYQYEAIKKHMNKAKAPFCPVCGADLLDDANDCYEYCPECGQKIDWSE